MIENGILENPAPDAALAYHVTSGKRPTGIYMYNNTGTMMFSVDCFKITVKGRGSPASGPVPVSLPALPRISLPSPEKFMYLSVVFPDDRGAAPAHNPKVMFNEDVCPLVPPAMPTVLRNG